MVFSSAVLSPSFSLPAYNEYILLFASQRGKKVHRDLVKYYSFPCFNFQEMERGEENRCILWALLVLFH